MSASEAIDTASREKTSIVTLFGEKVDQGGVYQCRAYNSAPGDTLKISLSAIVTGRESDGGIASYLIMSGFL